MNFGSYAPTIDAQAKRIAELEAERLRLVNLGKQWIQDRQGFRAKLIKALGEPWPPTPGTEPLDEEAIVTRVAALNTPPVKPLTEEPK